MNKTSINIAFFDIDKTILSINSGEALIKQAHKKGIIGKTGIIKAAYAGFQYKYRLNDSFKIINKMGLWLKGISEEKFNKISKEIFHKDIIPNIRPEIIDEIKRLKKQGTKVVILSSATQSICEPLANYLEFDDVICSKLEVNNGKFTGFPIGSFCFREEKLNQLVAYCSNLNFKLENSSYYADSIDDLPALEKVGYPVCVSPDKKLAKTAKKRDWVIEKW